MPQVLGFEVFTAVPGFLTRTRIWDWGNRMIITSDYGLFPHSLLSTSKTRAASSQHCEFDGLVLDLCVDTTWFWGLSMMSAMCALETSKSLEQLVLRVNCGGGHELIRTISVNHMRIVVFFVCSFKLPARSSKQVVPITVGSSPSCWW